MKVEPELMDHPKYLLLRRAVGEIALECLLRIWGHCESNKRGELWRGASPEYVEAVCRWKKRPGDLFIALERFGWVKAEGNAIRVHDWEKSNWRAVSNWELGSRPKAKAQANDKPRLSQGPSPLNEGMSEGVSEAGSLSPEVAVPGPEDCRKWAVAAGVDQDWAERKRVHTEGMHGWERNGRLIDWGKLWKVWYHEDVRGGRWPIKGGQVRASARRERLEILQELEFAKSEKNAARVAELQTELRAA